MNLAWLEQMLAAGESAAPPQLSRQIRTANAFALLGVVLCSTGTVFDSLAGFGPMVALDLSAAIAFAACWRLNARGEHRIGRVLLALGANALMIGNILLLGGIAQLRSVFFPLAMLPFLMFSVRERVALITCIAVPVVSYYALGGITVNRSELSLVEVNMLWAPFLAFTLLIAGTLAFALVDDRAQTKLIELRSRAARSARLVALGEMSSGIAHEVRNPLAAIHMAATQIAEHPEDTARVTQLGERIQRIVMRASKIIDSMRVVARDGSEDPFVPTPVHRIVEDALELCTKRLSEHAIEIRRAPDVASDLVLECRSVQLTQVLVNLLGNAFDAVAEASERWVGLDVRCEGDKVEIAVTNSGDAIPASVRARLFEPFFTTKPPDRGTGIGLSLSRELVEAHQGTLALDPTAAHTRFVIRVPARQPARVA